MASFVGIGTARGWINNGCGAVAAQASAAAMDIGSAGHNGTCLRSQFIAMTGAGHMRNGQLAPELCRGNDPEFQREGAGFIIVASPGLRTQILRRRACADPPTAILRCNKWTGILHDTVEGRRGVSQGTILQLYIEICVMVGLPIQEVTRNVRGIHQKLRDGMVPVNLLPRAAGLTIKCAVGTADQTTWPPGGSPVIARLACV